MNLDMFDIIGMFFDDDIYFVFVFECGLWIFELFNVCDLVLMLNLIV